MSVADAPGFSPSPLLADGVYGRLVAQAQRPRTGLERVNLAEARIPRKLRSHEVEFTGKQVAGGIHTETHSFQVGALALPFLG